MILRPLLIVVFVAAELFAIAFVGINLYSFFMCMFDPETFGDFGPLYNMFFASLGVLFNLAYVFVIYFVISKCLSRLRTVRQGNGLFEAEEIGNPDGLTTQ